MAQFESEDVRLLADVGFIAWSRGFDTEASCIFEAVRLLRPHHEAGYIGGALVRLRRGDCLGAVEYLRKPKPTNVVCTFLGVALLKLGERKEGLEMLSDAASRAQGDPSSRLASSILNEISAAGSPG